MVVARGGDLRLRQRDLAGGEGLFGEVELDIFQHQLFRTQQRQVGAFAVGGGALAFAAAGAGASVAVGSGPLLRVSAGAGGRGYRHRHRLARRDIERRQLQPRLFQHELELRRGPRHAVVQLGIDRGLAELAAQLARPPRGKPLRPQAGGFQRAGQRAVAQQQVAGVVQRLAVGHGQRGVDAGRLVPFRAGKTLDLGIERAERKLALARRRQRVLKPQPGLLHDDAVDRIAPRHVLGCRGRRRRGRCLGA